jgi:hypothetical protein
MDVERDIRRVLVFLIETGAGPDVRESMDRIEAKLDGRPLPIRKCWFADCHHPADAGRLFCEAHQRRVDFDDRFDRLVAGIG